ncbi:hypothetical protein V6N13_134237 [Hibiscus sabdariffa]
MFGFFSSLGAVVAYPIGTLHSEGIGYLASALGKPLYFDKATTLKQSLEKGGGLILASGEIVQVVDNQQVVECVSVGEVDEIHQVVDNVFVSFVHVLETTIVDPKGGDLDCSIYVSIIHKFLRLDNIVVCGDTTGGVVFSDSLRQCDTPQDVFVIALYRILEYKRTF